MPNLEDAVLLAVQAHRGQVDKAGQPYILHPLRVMFALKNEQERIVALLHDVVEDTDYSIDDLRKKGYSEKVLTALVCLTKRKGEDYMTFINRVMDNPIARQVKTADVRDNLDITRLANPSDDDFQRFKKYVKALAKLEERDN